MKAAVAFPLAAALSTLANAQNPLPIPVSAASVVAVIVRVSMFWHAPLAVLVGEMRDTIPLYAGPPGIDYMLYSFAQARCATMRIESVEPAA